MMHEKLTTLTRTELNQNMPDIYVIENKRLKSCQQKLVIVSSTNYYRGITCMKVRIPMQNLNIYVPECP